MSQTKKLIELFGKGKISEAGSLIKKILMAKAITKLNELKAKKKFVIRGGKKIKKFIGKKGMTLDGGKLTKTKASDLIKKKKSARKGAKTAKKGKAQKVRLQKKSIKKRGSLGIK